MAQRETGHTPGPWKVSEAEHQGLAGIVAVMEHSPDKVIAVRADARVREEEVSANARLIAAAPEMLAALCEVSMQIAQSTIECPIETSKDFFYLAEPIRKRIAALIAKVRSQVSAPASPLEG